jgi:hypothetical protein
MVANFRMPLVKCILFVVLLRLGKGLRERKCTENQRMKESDTTSSVVVINERMIA